MNAFEKTIKDYLDKVAQSDAVFAQKYDEGKNIEGCCVNLRKLLFLALASCFFSERASTLIVRHYAEFCACIWNT